VELYNAVVEYNTAGNDGGGVMNDTGATLYVWDQSQFWGNTAQTGAGIDNLGALQVSNAYFDYNSASWNGGGIANWASASVSSSTFEHDTAGNDGGGIYNGGSLSVHYSLFQYETATNFGGGLYSFGGVLISNPGEPNPLWTDSFMHNSARLGANYYISPLNWS
jgi:hypothetical protein